MCGKPSLIPTTAATPGSAIAIARDAQTAYCVRPTSPIPRIFPSMSVVGRIDETMTSTMRLFFSSRTPRMM